MANLLFGERSVAAAHGTSVRKQVGSWWRAYLTARRRREALLYLNSLDDDRLADLGIDRHIILEAARNRRVELGSIFSARRVRASQSGRRDKKLP